MCSFQIFNDNDRVLWFLYYVREINCQREHNVIDTYYENHVLVLRTIA